MLPLSEVRLGKAERPKGKRKSEPRVLTNDECFRLISHAAPGWRAYISTAVGTGLRQSELLGLTWADVGFDGGMVHVRQQLSRGSKGNPARLTDLKSHDSRRDVTLVPELARVLREHYMASAHKAADAFVFCTEDGKPIFQRNALRAVYQAAKRAGLNGEGQPPVSTHDLRHTWVCRMISTGLDLVTVSREAGHTPAVCAETYAGEFEKAKRSADTSAKIAAASAGAFA